ncbi:MAG: hypothetical protein JO277_08895 [Candidatus Eremiobacteraeota bacterium]|nr:hypothetical protein [Candidatus Eremiobacteraeota bacterium]
MSRSDGNVRTLVLPDGGTVDIPLPDSRSRFVVKSGGILSEAPGRTFPTLLVGVVLGVAVGIGATAWYFRSR